MKKKIASKTKIRFMLVLLILTTMACSTVPLTGRRQLSLVPESDMISLSLTEYDKVYQV